MEGSTARDHNQASTTLQTITFPYSITVNRILHLLYPTLLFRVRQVLLLESGLSWTKQRVFLSKRGFDIRMSKEPLS